MAVKDCGEAARLVKRWGGAAPALAQRRLEGAAIVLQAAAIKQKSRDLP